MTKSRHDDDVQYKPYLAGLLREAGGITSVEDLFRRAELPVTRLLQATCLGGRERPHPRRRSQTGSGLMRLDRIYIDGFKNLKGVDIDFDEERLATVVIGQNGTGKSNLIEAITDVFRFVDMNRGAPRFRYEIDYRIGGRKVRLSNREGRPLVIADGRATLVVLLSRGGRTNSFLILYSAITPGAARGSKSS